MRKRGIQWLVTALSLVAVLLAGCGGGAQRQGGQSLAPGTGSAIKIGLNYELSGEDATFGQNTVNGIMLGIKEINQAGGVLGKQLEPIKVDNKSDAAEATSVAARLITVDKVVAMLGTATSTNTIAAYPVARDNQVPQLTTSATAAKVTVDPDTGKVNEWVFRVCFIDPFQGVVGANFASRELGARKAAIYVDNNSDYSKGLAENFQEQFRKNGGQIVAEESFAKEDQDFRATLTRLRDSGADLIYLPAYYEKAGMIIKQARELGIELPVLGGDGFDSPELVEIAGVNALRSTFFTSHYSSQDNDQAVQKFVQAHKAEYNAEPDAFAALGYDAAYLIADAIKRAGEPAPAKIRGALAATRDFPAITGKLTFNEKHDPVKAAVILEMKDGRQVFRAKVQP